MTESGDVDVKPFKICVYDQEGDGTVYTVDTISTDDFGNFFLFLDQKTIAGYNQKYWKYFEQLLDDG